MAGVVKRSVAETIKTCAPRARQTAAPASGQLGFEGVVSKTIDAPYAPGNRGLWRNPNASIARSSSSLA